MLREKNENRVTVCTVQEPQHGTSLLVIFDEGNQGAIILYEQLVKYNYPCKLIYYLTDTEVNRKGLRDFILSSSVLFIGFSFASHSTKTAFSIADYIRKTFPQIPIVFGGVHPTLDPVSCLDHCDAVCLGEGDLAILEILERINAGYNYLVSNNLVYRNGDRIIRNALNPLISNLDILPIRRPYTADHIVIKNGHSYPLIQERYFEIMPFRKLSLTQDFSRGCPYSCNYCCNSNYKELYPEWAKVRSRSVSVTINEIYENIQLNSSLMRMFLIDDCFFAHNIEWLKDFVRQWKEKINISLTFFAIPEYVTYEKLRILCDINIDRISIGLQSGSRRMNAFLNRRFSPAQFLQTCRLIRSMGINLAIDLLFDNPWENENDQLETLDILTQIPKPFIISQYSLKVYPGTGLYKKYNENNEVFVTRNFSYNHYNSIKITDINILYLLTQILPRNFILYIFQHRSSPLMKLVLRSLYVLVLFSTPYLYLRIMVPRGIKRKIKFVFFFRRQGLRLIKDLFGLK